MAGLQKINWGQIDTTNVPNEIKVELGSLSTPIDKLYVKNIVGFDGSTSGFTSVNGPVFITDITPVYPDDNIINKVRSSDGIVLDSCLTSTQNVIVHVLAMTGISNYKPKVTVNNIPVELDGSIDKPLFLGTIEITLNNIDVLIAKHEDGSSHKTAIFYDNLPQIISSNFSGNYPGTQIELKSGDTFNVNVVSDLPFDAIKLLDYGAFNEQIHTFSPTVNKTISGAITRRNDFTEFYGAKLKIRKPNGTFSETFTISGVNDRFNGIYLNDLRPIVEINNIKYPDGQLALKDNESAIVEHNIENFDNVLYTYNEISVDRDNVYNPALSVFRTGGTYNINTPNLTITAYRTDNGSSVSKSCIVNIADELPTITIGGTTNRLISGGNDGTQPQYHTITINSNQNILDEPTMTASGGNFIYNNWKFVNNHQYSNVLMVHDNTPRGTYYFNGISVKNIADREVKSAENVNYIIGGFVSRTISLDSNDSECDINVIISDYDKVPSVLNWSSKLLPLKKPIGTEGSYISESWTVNLNNNNNKTTIKILDNSAVDSTTLPSTITINEIS